MTDLAHKLDTGGPFLQRLGRALLPVIGWRIAGQELVTAPQYVVIVAPHTSNWDLPVGLIAAHAFGLFREWQCGFMVKESATRWPVLGWLIRYFGGIPIRRNAAQDVVDQMVATLASHTRLLIVITPEGTRSRRDYWKTGFYRIALKAKVPIALGYLDYRRRLAGIGRVLEPTGDMDADFALIREFYSGIGALYPAKFGPVQFKPDS